MRRLAVARVLAVALVSALGCACSCQRATSPAGAASAEEFLAPLVRVRFGDPLASLRAVVPGLAASGWREGDRATFVSPGFATDIDLEVEVEVEVQTQAQAQVQAQDDVARLREVRLSIGPDRAADIEASLRARLGPGVSCGPLPAEIAAYRRSLWRLPDGAGVTLLHKPKALAVHVIKPASPRFEAAWKDCR